MPGLSASVGLGGANRAADVSQVQQLLDRFVARLDLPPLTADGDFGPRTEAAIKAFQREVVGMEHPDGRIDVGGHTWQALQGPAEAAAPAAPEAMPAGLGALFTPGPHAALAPQDYADAAARLGCEVAAIRAVAAVESGRNAFDAQGRPTILFERHLFHKLTEGRFAAQVPDLSNPSWGGYGKASAQYGRLARAYALDAEAALKSCSWGMFQILGLNHASAGFAAVEDFVRAMARGEAEHLQTFVAFILSHGSMHAALTRRDWAGFALRYNGPDYHKNRYDERIGERYRTFASA